MYSPSKLFIQKIIYFPYKSGLFTKNWFIKMNICQELVYHDEIFAKNWFIIIFAKKRFIMMKFCQELVDQDEIFSKCQELIYQNVIFAKNWFIMMKHLPRTDLSGWNICQELIYHYIIFAKNWFVVMNWFIKMRRTTSLMSIVDCSDGLTGSELLLNLLHSSSISFKGTINLN